MSATDGNDPFLPPAVQQQPTVLVVDDNPITLKLVRLTLAAEFHVLTAASGAAALAEFATHRPGLVLLDLLLPDMSGTEVLRQLRQLPGGGDVPVLAFTGVVTRFEEAGITTAGFTDFLVKPVEPSKLVRAVRDYLVPAASLPPVTACCRVLLVDDDPVQSGLSARYLIRAGYEAEVFASGADALRRMQALTPDVVLSAMLMSGVDGLELCYRLREDPRLRAVPVVLVSADHVTAADCELATALGASACVSWQQDFAQIVEVMEQVRRQPPPPLSLSPQAVQQRRNELLWRQLAHQRLLRREAVQRSVVQGALLQQLGMLSERLLHERGFRVQYDILLAQCLDAAGVSRGAVYIYEGLSSGSAGGSAGDVRALSLRAQVGCESVLEQAHALFQAVPLFSRVMAERAPVMIGSRAANVEERRLLEVADADSALLMPVYSTFDPVGLFLLLAGDRNLPTEDWLAFARSLSSQLGQTIALSEAIQALVASEHRSRLIFEHAGDAIFLTDRNARLVDANRAATQLTGYSAEQLSNVRVAELIENTDGGMGMAALRPAPGESTFAAEVQLLRADGERRFVSVSGARINENLFVSVVRDETQRRRDAELIRRQAHTDPVSGLANRAAFDLELSSAVDTATLNGGVFGVLLLRVGSFREVNDTLGHESGDRLLYDVGRRLCAALGEDDKVARFGGGQFAVLICCASAGSPLRRAAERLLSALNEPFVIAGVPVNAAPKIGVALFERGHTPAELLRCADVAAGIARRSRESLLFYDPTMDRHSPDRLKLLHELGEAIRAGALELWFQPKLDLPTRRVIGAEALLRWRHPQRGMVPPDAIIAMAERTTLIDDLSLWVIDKAVAQIRRWRQLGLDLSLSINLSMHNLHRGEVVEHLSSCVAASDLAPGSLIVELTESAVMEDPDRVQQQLQGLRDQSLGIALDDYGTGQSSLARLIRLPMTELKLDKSFIIELHAAHNLTIVRSTIKLAHDLALQVTAEGVETAEALEQLGAMGCDAAQGFFISKALPIEAFDRWLSDRNCSAQA